MQKILAGFSLIACLAGCSAPDAKVAVAPVSAEALGLQGAAPPLVDAAWWTMFGDSQLDRVMKDALSASPRLDEALARIREARAFLESSRAEQMPQISADASEQRTRLSERYIIPPPYGGSTQWQGQAQANLGWNLDLFGRQADAVRGARASLRAAALDYDAARLALSGAVVQTYIELVRSERLIAVAKANTEQREQSLGLVQTRIRSKLSSEMDARAAETLLAQSRQAVVRAEGQRVLLVHALALLAGRGADYYPTILPASLRLDAMPPVPQTLPADLLSRRPDVLSAQARIESAEAGRSVARKAFYPNINLNALVGTQALGLGNLFSTDAGTYGAGAAIHLPIFEGGKLRADHEAATARLDQAIAAYNGAVLGAVRESADALANLDTAKADLAHQREIVRGLSDVSRLNRVRVASGLDSRQELVGADIRLLQAQQDEANLEAQAALSNVQLLVAIGGGYRPAADGLPTPGPSTGIQ
ncbi:MAG TPA: efflux transporter outer membrane subunit [Sphingobium sp.]